VLYLGIFSFHPVFIGGEFVKVEGLHFTRLLEGRVIIEKKAVKGVAAI
jgi:hypothetical protein